MQALPPDLRVSILKNAKRARDSFFLNRKFRLAFPQLSKNPLTNQFLTDMARKPSRFNGDSYRGYKVSLRLVKENLTEYEPVGVHSPRDVYEFMKDLRNSDRERFYSLHLDTKNRIINCEDVSCGTASLSLVHPREVFKSALLSSCSSLIVVHNHPSGDPTPSLEDKEITKRLYECGELLGIELLDSVIIGEDSYYSFREGGLLKGKV